MAQVIYCPACRVYFTAELRGKSCPACGEELIHARAPSGRNLGFRRRTPHASRAVWDHIIRRDPCVYCGCMSARTIDHILPKALGGSKGSWTNRTGSCFRCNQDKAHTPLLFFLLEQQGMDLSALKNEEGNWPIPDHPDNRRAALVAQEEAHAKMTPSLHTYDAKVLLPEPACAPVSEVC